MPDILALLVCLNFELDSTIYRQFGHIISAMLAMKSKTQKKGKTWSAKGFQKQG
jgi:hypothetical protein